MKKRILSAVLAAIVALGVAPLRTTVSAAAFDDEYSAYTSDGTYIVNADGTATIYEYTGSSKEVIIPDIVDGIKVTAIGERAFENCSYVTSVIIPEGVVTIGKYAFYNSGITSIIIPKSVKRIENYAFDGCKNLYFVRFMASTPPVLGGISILRNCVSLKYIYVPDGAVAAYGSEALKKKYGNKFANIFSGYIFFDMRGSWGVSKTINELAWEVISGKWGNREERVRRLTAAGYNAKAVQARVNEILGIGTKSINQLAKEVINGKWGNKDERINRLTAAGYNAKDVQARVNELLGIGTKSVNQVAKEVIDGKWGNKDERVNRLTAAGYDAKAVQREVNRLLGY